MIPRASITAWRGAAPWPDNTQIEQDLVLSRALIELFRRPAFALGAVFRGGTALHKLYFDPPGRYWRPRDQPGGNQEVARDAFNLLALVEDYSRRQ